jgi:PAS domain S-box-containing protein
VTEQAGPRPRRGTKLASKLFLLFSIASVVPLLAAILTSFALFRAQNERLARELVAQKAASAELLLREEVERRREAVRELAASAPVVVNLDLGLDLAANNHLRAFIDRNGWKDCRIRVFLPDGRVFAEAGDADDRFPAAEAATARSGAQMGKPLVVELADSRIPALTVTAPIVSADSRSVGTLRADFLLKSILEHLSDAVEAPILLLPPGEVPSPTSIGGEEHLLGTFALREGEAVLTELAVGYPASLAWRKLAGSTPPLILVALLALAFCALASLYFNATIARPVRSLAASARRIAGGTYGMLSGISLSDEIGDLARSFDAMSLTLASQEKEREVAEEALRQSENQFRTIFDGVRDAIFVHRRSDGRILDVNAAAVRMYGYSRAEFQDLDVQAISAAEDGFTNERAVSVLSRAGSGEAVAEDWLARSKTGEKFWVEVAVRAARLGREDVVLVSCREIAARKKATEELERSLREKETLLKEVHHRVKNNFQIIESLLSLQAADGDESSALQRDPRARIHAMSLVHEKLYQSSDLASIAFDSYVEDLARELLLAYQIKDDRIRLAVRTEPVRIGIDRAVPCALILNEALTNALKYAYPDRAGDSVSPQPGEIRVELRAEGAEAVLSVEDDGAGFDQGAVSQSGGTGSLGMTLMSVLASQVGGRLSFASDKGTRAELRFRP